MCVLAALLIYSASYIQIRKVLQDNVQHWMREIAVARLDAMAERIRATLAYQDLDSAPASTYLAAMAGQGLQWQDPGSGMALGHPFVWQPTTQRWLLAPPDARRLEPALMEAGALARSGHSELLGARYEGLAVAHCLPEAGACIGISLPAEMLSQQLWHYVLMVLASMGKDMVLILLVIALVSRHTTRGLRALTASTEDIAQGQLEAPMPRIDGRDEVSRLALAFRHMQAALRTHIQDLKQATAAQQKLESELAIAHQIQQSMVPAAAQADSSLGYVVQALLLPAREVGGDFYDYFALGDGQLCVALGDVSGKGIPAALMMARSIALLRALAPQLRSPDATLAAVNRELCINNDECMFVTLFCAMLDLRTGELRYASAGHDAPLIKRQQQCRALPLETGPAAGLDALSSYPLHRVTLQSDDLLLLYSDGITEASNGQREWFGEDRLQAAAGHCLGATPADLLAAVQAAVAGFVAGAAASDDISMLALRYAPKPARARP